MNQDPVAVAADKDEQLVVDHAGKVAAYTLHMAVEDTAGAADNAHVEG